MANRYLNQFKHGFFGGRVEIYAKVTIGSTGAPTLVAASSKGVASIARNAAGKYTVVLNDRYYAFLGMQLLSKNATGISASPDVGLVSEAVAASGKSVVFQMTTGGVATDPASGDTLYLKIELKNTSV